MKMFHAVYSQLLRAVLNKAYIYVGNTDYSEIFLGVPQSAQENDRILP